MRGYGIQTAGYNDVCMVYIIVPNFVEVICECPQIDFSCLQNDCAEIGMWKKFFIS